MVNVAALPCSVLWQEMRPGRSEFVNLCSRRTPNTRRPRRPRQLRSTPINQPSTAFRRYSGRKKRTDFRRTTMLLEVTHDVGTTAPTQNQPLTETEAAARLGLKVATLRAWRNQGRG